MRSWWKKSKICAPTIQIVGRIVETNRRITQKRCREIREIFEFQWMHRNVPTGKGETADETGMVRLKSRLYRPKTLGFTLTPPPMNHHLHHHLSYADSFLVYENIQISIFFKKICYKVVIKIPIPIKNVSLMRRLSHFVVVTNLLTVCIRHLK